MKRGLTVVALCVTAMLAVAGCAQLPSPQADPSSGQESHPAEQLVPATPRGLAAAALTHFDADDLEWLGGRGEPGNPSADLVLKDRHSTSWFIEATAPADAPPTGPCGQDSGYRLVTCRKLPGGDRIEVLRGPARSRKGFMPMLIGRANRTDGSQILLEVHSVNAPAFPRGQAEQLLRDRLVGWQTTRELNQAGERLHPFHRPREVISDSLLTGPGDS